MKYQKTVYGMALPEVLIALATIAILLIPLMIVQATIFNQVVDLSNRLEGTWYAQNMVHRLGAMMHYEPREFSKTEKDLGGTTYHYIRANANKNSSLKDVPGLLAVSVTIEPKRKKKRNNKLITFVFKPEQIKK